MFKKLNTILITQITEREIDRSLCCNRNQQRSTVQIVLSQNRVNRNKAEQLKFGCSGIFSKTTADYLNQLEICV